MCIKPKMSYSIMKEKKWWNNNINEEFELSKPDKVDKFTGYHWSKLFSAIVSRYNFKNKNIFVGGCGTGIFEQKISNHTTVGKIVGMDLSEGMISLAKKRMKKCMFSAEFIVGNLEDTKLKDKSFDIAVIIDALHHIPNYRKVLKEMSRISKDIILFEPNAMNPIRRIGELRYKRSGPIEKSFYKTRLLKALETECGYNIKEIHVKNVGFIQSITPDFLIEPLKPVEKIFEKIPILKEFSSALFITAIRTKKAKRKSGLSISFF